MKKNYEKKETILIVSVIFFLLEILTFTNIVLEKEFSYKTMNGIILENNKILLLSNKKELKDIKKNSYFYENDKKVNYKIIEEKEILPNEKEIILEVKKQKSYKKNSPIIISIKDKKITRLNLIKNIWGGD